MAAVCGAALLAIRLTLGVEIVPLAKETPRMPCVHLRHLFQLCEDYQIKLGGTEVVHFACEQCGVQEVCPDMLMDEYDARHQEEKPKEEQQTQA
jgi:hypothetical protein